MLRQAPFFSGVEVEVCPVGAGRRLAADKGQGSVAGAQLSRTSPGGRMEEGPGL